MQPPPMQECLRVSLATEELTVARLAGTLQLTSEMVSVAIEQIADIIGWHEPGRHQWTALQLLYCDQGMQLVGAL